MIFAMDPITESDLKPIQKKMQELARKNFTVERLELTDEELQQHFADNPYKLEIINDKNRRWRRLNYLQAR